MEFLLMPADVSVVIPAFNREAVLSRCLVSVLGQFITPEKVIVVDDGSSDGTALVAEGLGVEVIRQSNAGPGAARNTGMSASRSTWVAFLDSDDEWAPDHLAYLLAHVPPADRTSPVLIGSNARAQPSGILRGHPYAPAKKLKPADMLFPASPLSTSAIMVDRRKALDIGGFSHMTLGEDRDLWCRLLEVGSGVALPRVTVTYHEHMQQVSGDAAKMLAARTDVAGAFRGRPWMTPALARKISAMTNWDALRLAMSMKEAGPALRALARLVTNPSSAVALAQGLKYRADMRAVR